MKKILTIAAMLLAVTSVSIGQTRYNDTSRQDINTEQMVMQMEREYGHELSITEAENISQCTLTFITESLPDFPLATCEFQARGMLWHAALPF